MILDKDYLIPVNQHIICTSQIVKLIDRLSISKWLELNRIRESMKSIKVAVL